MPYLEIHSKMITNVTEHNAWKIGALKRAKSEAEKGEFISHQAMGEWVNSLGTKNELSAPDADIFKPSNVI